MERDPGQDTRGLYIFGPPFAVIRIHPYGESNGASEVHFPVSEDELDGGYSATVLGFGIHRQGDKIEELRQSVREVVDC